MNTMERTFAIIKPDAVASRKAGQILARIEAAGFTVRAMRLQHLTKKEAEGFYAVHRERPFFGGLTDFMSSGPCVVMALEAPDAIRAWRTTIRSGEPRAGPDPEIPEWGNPTTVMGGDPASRGEATGGTETS